MAQSSNPPKVKASDSQAELKAAIQRLDALLVERAITSADETPAYPIVDEHKAWRTRMDGLVFDGRVRRSRLRRPGRYVR